MDWWADHSQALFFRHQHICSFAKKSYCNAGVFYESRISTETIFKIALSKLLIGVISQDSCLGHMATLLVLTKAIN